MYLVESKAIVRRACRSAARSGSSSISLADARDDVERVGVGQHPDAHEHRLLAARSARPGRSCRRRARRRRRRSRRTSVPSCWRMTSCLNSSTDSRSVVAVRFSWTQRALGLADRRQVVVGGQRLPHLRRADVERRHAVGLQPGAHRERAPAEDVGALHAVDRRQPRLHDADQVVGDLVVLEDLRAEAQVHRRELRVGRLDADGRDLRLGRQIGAHLVHARADVGERAGGVEVELQADVDRRQALDALRLDVVDAVGGGDRALERRGDEAAHQIGAGADVDGAHGDGRALEPAGTGAR